MFVSKEIDPKARLRAYVGQHPTQAAAAKALGLSAAYLSDMLAGRREASARVLAMLGLRRAVVAKGRA
jgi:DNA-binding transcriptional regulator YdaS (Cro superfamily)